jgi:hypothetical protein
MAAIAIRCSDVHAGIRCLETALDIGKFFRGFLFSPRSALCENPDIVVIDTDISNPQKLFENALEFIQPWQYLLFCPACVDVAPDASRALIGGLQTCEERILSPCVSTFPIVACSEAFGTPCTTLSEREWIAETTLRAPKFSGAVFGQRSTFLKPHVVCNPPFVIVREDPMCPRDWPIAKKMRRCK